MLISNFCLIKPLRYQQKKFWSESNGSRYIGHHVVWSPIYGGRHHWAYSRVKFCCMWGTQFKEAYLPRPEWGAVDLDGQLFSPVTMACTLVGVLYNSLRLIRLFSKISKTEEQILISKWSPISVFFMVLIA